MPKGISKIEVAEIEVEAEIEIEVAEISLAYSSQIQRISVDPGRRDGSIVPNPITPRGNRFLKVCAKFQI
jgi:hypothetical protein